MLDIMDMSENNQVFCFVEVLQPQARVKLYEPSHKVSRMKVLIDQTEVTIDKMEERIDLLRVQTLSHLEGLPNRPNRSNDRQNGSLDSCCLNVGQEI